MLPHFRTACGNPSSLHSAGQEAAAALADARARVAKLLHAARPDEIVFTSGGSEADNQAILSAAALGARKDKKHIISTKFEHHAVLHTLKKLAREGYDITLLDIPADGVIRPEQVAEAIREDTALVSVMFANNEIGTIQPIAEIGAICRERGVLFHTDAVQAVGHIAVDVQAMNIDLLSLSAHKFHGPKGVGALYARRGVWIQPLIEGGAQERGKRAGTENIPGIVGMAKALELACDRMEEHAARMQAQRDRLIAALSKIPHSILNGDAERRLPNNVHFCFEGIEGESLLLYLDDEGIEASSGSACTSGSLDPSHVLLALGRVHDVAHGSLRLTLSYETTDEEIDHIIDAVPRVVARLRDISPVWDALERGERPYILA
jgi:cysteine desulfurase